MPSAERLALSSKHLALRSPREAAVWSYLRWLRSPSRVDAAAERELARSNWDPRDRALFLEILYGVVRQHGRLRWLTKRLSTGREQPDNAGLACVAVGLYQLLFLDRIPDYAAVDGSVRLAKRLGGPSLGGWVNAVLRRAAQEREELLQAAPPESKHGLCERLAVLHSHPPWMVARWLQSLPAETITRFLEWNNRRPGLTLRVNIVRAAPDEVLTWFTAAGIGAARTTIDPQFIAIEHSGEPLGLEPLRLGQVTVQDVSQGLVGKLVSPQPGEEILDLCSAPGGKVGHLAELCPECVLVATDKAPERLELVRQLVERNSYRNVALEPFDAVIGSRRLYDAVLMDAPCSGTGVLARRPDLRWRRSPDDIRRMAAVQISLLHYAADRLKPNGRLIYSTCSVEPEENGEVVARLLAERRDLRGAPVTPHLPESVPTPTGRLELWGPEIAADGVFATILARKA